jgi:hypothetical protein
MMNLKIINFIKGSKIKKIMKNENQIRNKRTFDIFGYEVSIENNTQFHKSIKNKNKIIKQMKIIFIQLFA